MKKKIIISGYGGQGVMVAGTLLCQAGIHENRNVTFFPSYGAEMRGGTANCHVIISDTPIGSPIIDKPDVLIAFNEPSFLKFSSRVIENGIILANTSLFNPKSTNNKIIEIPANNLAEDCGNILALNMVMAGALIKQDPFLEINSILNTIPTVLTQKKEKLWDLNKKAATAGYNYNFANP